MINLTWGRVTSAMLAVTFTIACSKSPEQYRTSQGGVDNRKPSRLPGGEVLKPTNPGGGIDPDINAGETQAEHDQRVRQNSLQDIVYGGGAGGITLTTTFDDSRKILTRPLVGPTADEGLAVYEEQIAVYWKKDDPRVPDVILVLNGYLGRLQLPTPLKPVEIGEELKDFFPAADANGLDFLRKLYVGFEKVDPSYDCVAEQTCGLAPNDQYVILVLPKMYIFVTKDTRRTLFRIALLKNVPSGALNNEFDLALGQISLKKAAANGAEKIALGDTLKHVRETAGTDTDTRVSPKGFTKSFDGVALGFTKSRYDRNYVSPDDSEVLNAIMVYGQNLNPVRIAGQYAVLTAAEHGLQLVVKPELAADDLFLQTQLQPIGGLVAIQRQLLDQVIGLVEQSFPKASDTVVVTKRVVGFNADGKERTFQAILSHFDTKANKGAQILVEISEQTGGVTYLAALLDDPINRVVLPTLNKPIGAGKGELGGLKLGQKLLLSDIDEGRGEATVTIAQGTERLSTRSAYVKDTSVHLVYSEDGNLRETNQPLRFLSSVAGVQLGVNALQEQGGQVLAEINVIKLASNVVGIDGVCGLKKQLKIGAVDQDILKDLRAAGGCRFMIATDDKSNAIVSTIYIPEQNLALGFDGRELDSVIIYKKPSQ